MPDTQNPLARLETLEAARRNDPDAVLEWWDTLPAVDLDDMLGEWAGSLVPTGHKGEPLLDKLRWAGKRFKSADDVDPMVCRGKAHELVASTVMGGATLQRRAYRGVETATMVYDRHPVADHFRRVDADTVVGVMDRKGERRPLVFTLRRRSA